MTENDHDPFEDDLFPNDGLNDEEQVIASHTELTPVPYSCAACGEPNETLLDLGAGYHQQYTEDCAVCCRPNLITLTIDEETLEVIVENELEYE